MKDHYAILGIPRNSSQCDVKKAYEMFDRRLNIGKKLQPEEIKKLRVDIGLAYRVLSDPKKRQNYNNELDEFELKRAEKNKKKKKKPLPAEEEWDVSQEAAYKNLQDITPKASKKDIEQARKQKDKNMSARKSVPREFYSH